ncbi:MAG: DUF1329 domain-containing protein [Pseudomonadota bacterium]
MPKSKLLVGIALAGLVWGALAMPARAAAIETGTVVHAGNLDDLLGQTFDGTPLSELIPEQFQWQIRAKGLTMKLAQPKPHLLDPVWLKASEKNRGTVSLDPKTRAVKGWEAGVPFPDVKTNDPDAGLKIIWNLFYGKPNGDSQIFPNGTAIMINGESGIEGITRQQFTRILLKGLLRRKDAPTLGSGKIFEKDLLVMTAPEVFKGSGFLYYRYDTGETDYLLIYAKDANKVVKWSGEFWMDEVGETDFLGDDLMIFSAYPTWYDAYKVLGKKKILVVAETANPYWNPKEKERNKRYPGFNIENWPHWNPVDEWMPREVYVLEAKAPVLHPYSRKVIYIDAKTWVPYLGEFYTKQDELWKTTIQGYRTFPIEKEPKGTILWPVWAMIADFRKNHATILATDGSVRFNEEIDPSWVNLDTLKGGRKGVEVDVPWSELSPEE